jgi:serralysin
MANPISIQGAANQDINGVMSGVSWDTLDLTYSFPTSASLYGDSYGLKETENNFQSLSPTQAAVARQVFGMISSVTNLTFTEVQETSVNHADLRLARSDAPEAAWSYFPDASPEGGDTWFRTSGGWFDSPTAGSYAFYVFLHEILHGLGLKHGNDPSAFGAMTAGHDSMEYSVTTYRSYVGASGQYVENETWGYAQTLMMYDIAALQHMYGADFSTNGGNTTYQWDPATGQAFINGQGQGAPGGNRIFMTIWDGNGIDTYNFSNYGTGLTVDLRPGEWSTASAAQLAQLGAGHTARGNIANALLYQGDTRSLIENAIGGSGNDQIVGNVAANDLKGMNGADRLYGLEGADRLIGGKGLDVLAGGTGRDVFVFDAKPNKTTNWDRITDFVVKDDTIYIENAVFTKVGKSGKLAGGAYWTGSKAHDASDRVFYNKKTGALSYDPDGTGHLASIKFAQLDKGLKMTAADFFLT